MEKPRDDAIADNIFQTEVVEEDGRTEPEPDVLAQYNKYECY